MRSMRRVARYFAAVTALVPCSAWVLAQAPCPQPESTPASIVVSIAAKTGEDQFPFIELSVKNLTNHPLTDESIDGSLGPRIHVDGIHGPASRTIWFRQRSLEYGYPSLMYDRMGAPVREFAPGETLSLRYLLKGVVLLNEPGMYSAYIEVHDPAETCDPNAKWLRSNTVQFALTPEEAKAWDAYAGPPRMGASIKMREATVSSGQAPAVQIEVRNDASTDHAGDDFFPHVERDSIEVTKTSYYRERLHEPGARQYGIFEGPQPTFSETRKEHFIKPHDSSAWEIDLRNFYNLDAPGKYTVYIEFPDISGRILRSNTIEFAIASPN